MKQPTSALGASLPERRGARWVSASFSVLPTSSTETASTISALPGTTKP